MIRTWLLKRRQKSAEAAFARKWMVPEPNRKRDPLFARKWMSRWDDPPSRMTQLRKSWTLRLAAGGSTALIATGGMAYAGVLPEPVQDVISKAAEKVGLELPSSEPESEPSGTDTSDAVHEVIDKKGELESGRDFGREVSGAAHEANQKRREAKEAEKAEKAERKEAKGKDRPADSKDDASPGHGGRKTHPIKDENGKSSDKGRPENPGKPEDKGKPENPGKPEDKGKPEKPGKPGGADEPGSQTVPGEPGKPSKPEKDS